MNGVAHAASPLSVSSVAQLTLSLLAIIAFIFALSFVLKRFKLAAPRGRGGISVIDELAVGPRERIVLVRVGDGQVLIGVGAAGMVALTPLATPIIVGDAPAGAPFATALRDFLRGAGA